MFDLNQGLFTIYNLLVARFNQFCCHQSAKHTSFHSRYSIPNDLHISCNNFFQCSGKNFVFANFVSPFEGSQFFPVLFCSPTKRNILKYSDFSWLLTLKIHTNYSIGFSFSKFCLRFGRWWWCAKSLPLYSAIITLLMSFCWQLTIPC